MVTMAGTTTIIDLANREPTTGAIGVVTSRQHYRKGHAVYRPILRPAYPVVSKPRRSWVSFGVGCPL